MPLHIFGSVGLAGSSNASSASSHNCWRAPSGLIIHRSEISTENAYYHTVIYKRGIVNIALQPDVVKRGRSISTSSSRHCWSFGDEKQKIVDCFVFSSISCAHLWPEQTSNYAFNDNRTKEEHCHCFYSQLAAVRIKQLFRLWSPILFTGTGYNRQLIPQTLCLFLSFSEWPHFPSRMLVIDLWTKRIVPRHISRDSGMRE